MQRQAWYEKLWHKVKYLYVINLSKRILFGAIPYYWFSILPPPDSRSTKPYRTYMKHRRYYQMFDFEEEYDEKRYTVYKDKQRGLHYVLNSQGRRLYFKRGYSSNYAEYYYRSLAMEQDPRSAHHYLDNLSDVKGKAFIDAGAAEGYTSLEVIEEAEHVYLFETDESWIEALEATFAPWREKVTIVGKFVGDKDGEHEVTLDTFFSDKPRTPLFIKMDIEGAERYALKGSKRLFEEWPVDFAVCLYHKDDYHVVPPILRDFGCKFKEQYGFFIGDYRYALARGSNLKK